MSMSISMRSLSGHFSMKNWMKRMMKWPPSPSFLANDLLSHTFYAAQQQLHVHCTKLSVLHTLIPIFQIIQVIKFYGWRTKKSGKEWANERTDGWINNKQKIMLSISNWSDFWHEFCIVLSKKQNVRKFLI